MDQQSIEDQNLVERYVTGRLSAEEAARFEEYFIANPECAAEVQAAQRLHRGLEVVAAREMVGASLAVGVWHRLLRSRALRLVPLLLLAVAVVPLAFQAQRISRLEDSLAAALEPRVNTPIFELTSFRSSDLETQPDHFLTLSPDPEWIVLALMLPDSRQTSFQVEIRDAAKNQIWKAEDLQLDPLGRLVMTLPSPLLPTGDYEILVAADTGTGEPAPAGRFALRVAVNS